MKLTSEVQIPPVIIFGAGEAKRTGAEIKKLSVKKVLIVTDKIMEKVGNLETIKRSLESENIAWEIFDDITQEPVMEYVDKGISLYKKSNCEALIGLGGGSAIDTAKAISVMVTNAGKIQDYMGMDKIKNPGVPMVSIPTTAGTGSEVSKYSIITDAQKNIKYLTGSFYLIPDVAVIDPLLTISMPKSVTAATGIDALCHAIECYVSEKANPMSDMFTLSAITLLSNNLRQAWANGDNLEARSKTMLGATQAGIALSVSTVTLVHGMSRPIGAYFHVPHGMSNAALLSTVMEYSILGNPKRFAKVAGAMGENISQMSSLEAAQKAVLAVKKLIEDIKIPSLKELGIKKEDLEKWAPKMAQDAIDSGSPGNNPRKASLEDIIELYSIAYSRG